MQSRRAKRCHCHFLAEDDSGFCDADAGDRRQQQQQQQQLRTAGVGIGALPAHDAAEAVGGTADDSGQRQYRLLIWLVA